MHNNLSQIEFYFPSGEFKDKYDLVDSIISLMKKQGSVDYSGYKDAELLKQGLLAYIGNGSLERYKEISQEEKLDIEGAILETIKQCNDKLSIPVKNFIFVHPYFPTQDDKIFEGVMAVAVYNCVFHLFVNLDEYSNQSLENTVTHELNHTIYYYHHYADFNNYTLLDEVLLEGLAENFREQYFDYNATRWARALSKEEALDELNKAKDSFRSRDQKVIKGFLFGNDKHKKWTGYSVGYWLVKEFIDNNTDLSWDELMKTQAEKFLEVVNK